MIFNVIYAEDKMLAVLSLLIALPALMFSLSIHEYAHGFAAYKQGDGYAKAAGRLTLNPFAHIDPLGTLMMLLVGFGWAKPVPIVPANFKNQKRGMITVSLAGIIANIILSFIALFLYYFFFYMIFSKIGWFYTTEAGAITTQIVTLALSYLVTLNVTLAVFNLMPIPPLDGYKFFKELTIGKINYRFFANYERYATIVLIVFLVLGNRIGFISSISNFLIDQMSKVMDLIFTAFV